MAVGPGPHRLLQRNDAVAAGLVLDHDRLAEFFLEVLAENAGDDVGRAAGPVRDEDADRLGRIVGCGVGGADGLQEQAKRRAETVSSSSSQVHLQDARVRPRNQGGVHARTSLSSNQFHISAQPRLR